MAIFGNASVKDGATTINVIGSTTDIYLNYIFGVLTLIPFALSTLLNPVVFIYKYNRPRSAASLLYMVLSSSDFMTNIWRPVVLSYTLFSPGLDDYVSRTCTATRLFRAFYYNLVTELSLTATVCLAVMRFIAIQVPFYRPRKLLFFGAIVAWTLLVMIPRTVVKLWVCNTDSVEEFFVMWARPQQSLLVWGSEQVYMKVLCVRYMIATFTALAASGLTVISMLRKKNTPHTRSRNRGSIAIVVMNAALVMNLILIFKDLVLPTFVPDYKYNTTITPDSSTILSFFVISNGPVILSAFNPLVIVLFSSQIKEFIRVKLGLARVKPNVLQNGALEIKEVD